jgi:hypothetical protein
VTIIQNHNTNHNLSLAVNTAQCAQIPSLRLDVWRHQAVTPPGTEGIVVEDTQSEREEERRQEAEELGAGVGEPLFLLTPAFMAYAEEE